MSLSEEVRIALDGKWRHVREQSRRELAEMDLAYDLDLDIDAARERTLRQLEGLVDTGVPAAGFRTEHGGGGDPGMAVTGIEMLAQFDLSLMVKAGVQWGLFGGAVENLGTERHRDLIPRLISLDLVGCYAMTEIGHGSNVQHLETTATFDADTQEFVVDSPTPSATKDYIGNAAAHATVAAVYAQLVTRGENHGVHCFIVPIRDEKGQTCDGVEIGDDRHKGGLGGVDNGRLSFHQVRIPRENLLNKYGDVAEDGTYSSPIEDVNRRFFTMLGTLVRGRISVGGSALAAAEVALSIAGRYALERRQFGQDGEPEVLLADYRVHQRRLLPLIARSYAYRFAQNQQVSRMDRLQRSTEPDLQEQRELEGRAAGLKAIMTWHASRAINESREMCGGAGYLAENRLTVLRGDIDVFTTFEGDNHVMLQLLSKELLTSYAKEVGGLDAVGMVRFVAETVAETVRERTAASQLIQRLIDAAPTGGDAHDLLDRGTQLSLFEDREQHLIETAARRLQRAAKAEGDEAFRIFNEAQDHLIRCGRAHVDRVVLEAFTAGIARCEDPDAADLLRKVCTLYALSVIEDDLAWFMAHNRISDQRAKAVTQLLNEQLAELRPHLLTLIEGLGVPEETLGAAMLLKQ
ncbi:MULTISPECIES: acyl-CoA dehydrogenase [unclassified Aeromicrobium]|jgi:acyl-CoA oxidase|uniref:acyl-CoA dehydrogenase family protein n=1 Tax=unclassified Aeromicrobium TaxID=2633570 RepID=UPI0007003010|nr:MULTISPECIES: acyl-CoA dehydrogenase [unclassified Aeromicrobium]KQO36416.1 acyl-CoA oxidase [Aeromicrobium sp. Leaf245]KQP27882.1 acyl-CoA oxidase [Aeromicrobium sp. Leaf272]KQP78363.1 acyl-CoA oxidase [Aeromicrobium sp. Leaf289]